MYECSNCNSEIEVNQKYCKKCGARLIWKGGEESSNKDLENEARRQLVGIKIVTIFGIILWGSFWLAGTIDSISAGGGEGIFSFFIYTLLFGGILTIHIFGLIGLIKRKAYAIPLSRANLIFSGGIIIWIILWGRLNMPTVKFYLNYKEFDSPEDLNQEKKDILAPKSSIEKEDSTIKEPKNTSRNDKIYCPFCRTELPSNAKYCKHCGEEI